MDLGGKIRRAKRIFIHIGYFSVGEVRRTNNGNNQTQFLYTNAAKTNQKHRGKTNVLSLLFNNVNVETNIMKCGRVSQQLKTCFVNFSGTTGGTAPDDKGCTHMA